MKYRAIALALGCALAACSGNFASGGTEEPDGGLTPQMNQNTSPVPGDEQKSSRHDESATTTTGDTVTYPFSGAASGLQCPQVDGYTCVLSFNLPPATPTPSPAPHKNGKHAKKTHATPTPSPSPSADPTASDVSASPDASTSPESSASPNATTSPGPQITLHLDATPKDAPAMVNPDPKALGTIALLDVRMSADADVTIQGGASADFTLPSSQIGGRGFAIEFFQETTGRHNKHNDRFVASFARSTVSGDTLHFAFSPPPIAVKKGETWLLVLYGDERPDLTPSPAPSASPSDESSPDADASPSAEPTGDASPQASNAPQ